MTQLFIPPLGFELTLTEDWTFKIFDERRNNSIFIAAGLECPRFQEGFRSASLAQRETLLSNAGWGYDGGFADAHYHHPDNFYTTLTLRAGTKLKIARIYIRLGQDDFNSVTFTCPLFVSKPGDPLFKAVGRKGLRFWVKLEDVNKINFNQSLEASA